MCQQTEDPVMVPRDSVEYTLGHKLNAASPRRAGFGYSYALSLSAIEVEALIEWADFCAVANGDDAAWEPSARTALRAARALQDRLRRQQSIEPAMLRP